MNVQNKKYILVNSKHLYFIILAFTICLSGFIGPGFWKIKSPKLSYFLKERSNINSSINQEYSNFYDLKLNNINVNTKSLSSVQMLDKNIAIAWSEQTIRNLDKNLKLPRTFFTKLPNNINEYTPALKKNIFISILLPIILKENELIVQERSSMKLAFLENNFVKIKYYSKKYKVNNYKKINFFKISSLQMFQIKEELLNKINQIPVSMTLAQAAIESGWGSSRFAQEGNALFGEWTWKNNEGLKPKGNLNAKFSVKSFVNIQESVNSYLLNLNTHPAYKKMRNYRTLTTGKGKKLSGYETASYLEKYAEIGYEYVLKVTSIIKNNNFHKYDYIKLENYNN